jgi:hypothetical protein
MAWLGSWVEAGYGGVVVWSLLTSGEDRVDMRRYLWPPSVKWLLAHVLSGGRGLFFLVGGYGVGKSSALRAIRWALELRGRRCLLETWDPWSRFRMMEAGYPKVDVVLVDFPDLGLRGVRGFERLVDSLSDEWSLKRKGMVFVVVVPRRLFGGHSFFGRGVRVDLPPLSEGDLLAAYRGRFGGFEPFTEEALRLVAAYSGGVFRRFLVYILLCLGLTPSGRGVIGVGEVASAVSAEERLQELALDLEVGLRPRDVERLRRALTALRVGGPLNQKVLAGRLSVSQATMCRVVARLEELGLVGRRRGEGKELVLHLI